MIKDRKYLYRSSVVDGVKELDYLRTQLVYRDFQISNEVTVTDATAHRPDLISRVAYGSPHYGWLIMDHNDILDPYIQLTTGTVLEVPDISDYFDFYNENSVVSRRSS